MRMHPPVARRPNAVIVGPVVTAIDPGSTSGSGCAIEIRMTRTDKVCWAFVPVGLREAVSAMSIGMDLVVGKQSNRFVVMAAPRMAGLAMIEGRQQE